MHPETVETLFLRFVERADSAALATVFDRTAHEILRVALHLAGNPIDAEDLLQATFTSAITSAQAYDRTRPLVPWLLGILAHEAGTWRRKERRAALPERLLPKPELDPARVAEHAELVDALTEKVSHLPEHYRSVLVLYLRHGLAPVEIAEVLHRAPATVRSQLARGLELLRKALPIGLATLLMTAIVPARGLAAVREAVLAGARPTLRATLVAKGLSLLLAAFLVVGLGTIAWPSSPVQVPAGAAPAEAAGSTELVAPSREPVPASEPQERDPGARTKPSSAPSEGLVTIRGRCIVAATRLPLAGTKAVLRGDPRGAEEMAKHGPVQWRAPEPATGDADGRFTLRFAPPPPFQFSLDLSAEGFAPRTGRWLSLVPGADVDLGEIELTKGYVVSGRVVDQEGKPVPKTSVGVMRLPLPLAPGMVANDFRWGFSNDRGEFVIKAPIPVGTWPLEVHGPGQHLGPDVVVVREGRGADPLPIVVRSTPVISGIVVDETGVPVPRVTLKAAGSGAGHMISAGTRDDDGTFVLRALDVGSPPISIEVSDPGPCEPGEATGTVAWGTKDVRIVLERALSVELLVVEKETGDPVETYAVVCHATRSCEGRPCGPRLGGQHPGGRVVVDKVWRGENVLVVQPNDPALAPSAQLAFIAADGGTRPLRVELERKAGFPVLVTGRGGAAVAGAKVELFEGIETPAGPVPLPIFEATTDTHGRAILHALRDAKLAEVRVRGPGHAPRVVKLGAEVPRRIELEPGASIEGLLVPAAVLGWKPRIQAWPAGDPMPLATVGMDFQAQPPVSADGKFRLTDLAPGEWIVAPVVTISLRTTGFCPMLYVLSLIHI